MQVHKKPITFPEALKKLEHYCAYQERCHKEVENKLREYHLITEAKNQIILHLIEHNFLNETRYAQSFTRGKFRIKKWGKLRITNELKAKNISAYNIKKGMKEIDDSEYYDTFEKLTNKKWKSLHSEPLEKAKQKLITYLQYRGWENELIFEKIAEIKAKTQ